MDSCTSAYVLLSFLRLNLEPFQSGFRLACYIRGCSYGVISCIDLIETALGAVEANRITWLVAEKDHMKEGAKFMNSYSL